MIVVVPIGKQEPLVKPAVGAEVIDTEGVEQLSAAVGATQLAVPQSAIVVTLILVGQLVNVGGVTSLSQGFVPPVVTFMSLFIVQTFSHLSLKNVTKIL